MIHKRHKYDLIVIFATLNLAIAMFLSVSHYLDFQVPCTITHGCQTVLTSKYSVLLGIPLAVWGVAFYAAIIVSSLLANHYKTWRTVLTWLLAIGALLAVVFISLQFFVIKSVCEYCLTTDTITILLFLWDLNIEAHSLPPF